MRKLLVLSVALAVVQLSYGQNNLPDVDKSPLDVCYAPAEYPQLKVQGSLKEMPVARVIYSRPKREGRTVFGSLVEYGKLWRLGANEATEIEFYKPVTIDGNKIPKGRYTLYAIVDENFWTLIINKETDVWGSFVYKQAKDVARIKVPVEKTETTLESLAMSFEKQGSNQINLIIAWDTVKVSMPVKF